MASARKRKEFVIKIVFGIIALSMILSSLAGGLLFF